MNKLFSALIAAVILVALVSCGTPAAPTGYAPGQTVEAYAYTHGGYVGQAVVTTDAEGAIEVTLNEAFLPHTLAGVDFEAAEWTEDNTAFYLSRGNESRVAKWVEFDGTVYVGTTVGGSITYVEADENGAPAGGQDLELMITKNQATMAAYYDIIAAGGFKTFTEFGGSATPVTTTHYGSLFKRGSSYWTNGLTWATNIDAIETFAEENGVGFSPSEMVRASEEDSKGLKQWSVADAVTGATASDFKDYFGVIQRAVGQLKMQ